MINVLLFVDPFLQANMEHVRESCGESFLRVSRGITENVLRINMVMKGRITSTDMKASGKFTSLGRPIVYSDRFFFFAL
jgi:hypothetical protein